MNSIERTQAFRELARSLSGRDLAVYARAGKDPDEPLLGPPQPSARVLILGRDPGRHEIEQGEPFIGAGGRKVREGLWRHLFAGEPPDAQALREVGRYVAWANLVPYKPLGNKVWPKPTRAAFALLVRDLLLCGWQGEHILALGREAFDWFGLACPETREVLDRAWACDDRYEKSVVLTLTQPGTPAKTVQIHPMPHPSPLNVRWGRHFPALFAQALVRTGLSRTSWSVDPAQPEPVPSCWKA